MKSGGASIVWPVRHYWSNLRLSIDWEGRSAVARPWVFMVTQNDFLRAGNQSILNTVKGYIDGGFDVVLLSARPKDDPAFYSFEELPEDLREHLQVHFFSPALRPCIRFFRSLRRALTLQKPVWRDNGEACGISNRRQVSDQFGIGVGTFQDCVMTAFSAMSFIIGGFVPAIRIARKFKPKVLYGYEIYGTCLALCIRLVMHGSVVFVTRFQGTILYPHVVEMRKSVWRFPPHAIALKVTTPDLLIMANDGTRGYELCQAIGCDMTRVRFWVNGSSQDVFRIPDFDCDEWRKVKGFNQETFILLVTSRLVPWKRIDRALLLLADLKVQASPIDWLLVIIGDGDQREHLRLRAEELGIRDAVRFLGNRPHSQVNEYLNGCDCVLSLNDYSNLGNPVLEALRVGKVVATIDDGSTTSILKPNVNSLMVKMNQFPAGLSKLLIRFASDEGYRSQLETCASRDGEVVVLSWPERMKLEVEEVRACMLTSQ